MESNCGKVDFEFTNVTIYVGGYMKRRLTIKYATMINIIVAFIIVCYAGPFASYKGNLMLIALLGVVLLMTSEIPSLYTKKHLNSWKILAVYLVLNALMNLPYSLKYLLIFFVGYTLINRNLTCDDYRLIFSICKAVAILEALFIMLQFYWPSIYYPFAQKWFFYSNQYQQVTYLGQYCKQLSGLFYEVSFAAFVLSIGIVFCAVEMFEKCNKLKVCINFCIIFISYYAIVLTGKRSFILIIPTVIIILYLIKIRQKLTIKHIIIFLLGVIALIFFGGRVYEIILNIISKGKGNAADLSSRELFWGLAFNMFKENPLLGKGINSFDIAFNASGIRSVYYDFAGAHNSYIQLLGETGILGIVLYVNAIISSLYRGIKILLNGCREELYLYSAIGILVVMLIYGLSGNVLYQPQELITFFWIIAVIENYCEQEKRK